ncbi:MAG: hypothetical protein M0Q91_00295 [Methanoregula sp.]|jgi:hypothetical protein|nr:hypothetical protein [Methanoregula sp.]
MITGLPISFIATGGYPNAANGPSERCLRTKVTNRSQAVSPSPCASREGVTKRST